MVFVVWIDAESIDEWTERHEIDAIEPEVHSAGFLVSEDKNLLTIAVNHDTKNDSFSCIIKIPQGMIRFKKFI